MTPDQIRRVQESFALVLSAREVAASVFYDRLFEIAPDTRAMFPRDMDAQRDKFMATLTSVVVGLHEMARIMPIARDLARRHAAYGVVPTDYVPVGQSLLDALETVLPPDDFPEKTRDAWAEAYATLSNDMIDAAYQEKDLAS
jgi:nitric oxide dioxygenase